MRAAYKTGDLKDGIGLIFYLIHLKTFDSFFFFRIVKKKPTSNEIIINYPHLTVVD